MVDAGFLELVRYGIRRADDPLIVDSLKVVDHTLKYETPYGPCWRRYNHDGYGQKKDGGAYDGSGQGRAWPLLGGERAHYELAAGGDYKSLISTYERFASVGGMFPEQVWDHDDMPQAAMYEGRPADSAQPLVWAHAEYIKLLRSVVDGQIFDTISVVADRYAVEPGTRTFRSEVDIFQVARPIMHVSPGMTLRIVDPHRFNVSYTFDDWTTGQQATSKVVGYPGSYVDISTPVLGEGETKTLIFTMHWPEQAAVADHWLGRNVEITIVGNNHSIAAPLEQKPVS